MILLILNFIAMIHLLPQLPYSVESLEPNLSSETLEYHYGKHHKTYVNNLNQLIVGTPFEKMTLEQIVEESEGPIYNNAAQVWNHTFYFYSFAQNPQHSPSGPLLKMIEKDFGSFETFKELFTKSAIALFGSGWVWLVEDKHEGKLSIVSESNAGNPLRHGLKPLLTCDVWEHAYYIDYRNLRADYMKAFWNILDWKVIDKRYEKSFDAE